MQKRTSIKQIIGHSFILAFISAAFLIPGAAQARYAAIVIEFESGRVLHAVNADTRNYPASLTKMMTLYMAFDAIRRGKLRMDQPLTVSARAAAARPSRLGLKRGGKIIARDAILALITKSANDAAVVIAEAISGSERKFSRAMTQKARQIGMARTNFRNASGLPNRRQLSTARDMATLANRLLTDHADQYHMFSTQYFEYRGRRYRNHNGLLARYPGADGIKTGYTRASGYNLVASATLEGRRVIGVIFGGKSARARDARMRRLLDRAFTKLDIKKPSPSKRNVAGASRKKPKARSKPDVSMGAARALHKPKSVANQSVGRKNPKKQEWAIQVGAFKARGPARQAATKAVRHLPNMRRLAQVAIVPAQVGDEMYYRARLVGLSKSNATKACRKLQRKKVTCVTVPPVGSAP